MLKNKRDDWCFEEFGEVAIESISKEVLSYYDEWLIDTTRQNSYETHKDTFAFEIRSLDYFHSFGTDGICVTKRNLSSDAARKEFFDIVGYVESLAGGKLIRAEFINMKPRSRIRTHKDRSDVLYVARRFHVPIKTNYLVTFSSGAEVRNLKTGTLYELNNIKYHSVQNASDDNRIHLILDVLPNDYLEGIRFIDETE
jgi:hypothetical protein